MKKQIQQLMSHQNRKKRERVENSTKKQKAAREGSRKVSQPSLLFAMNICSKAKIV
jgi:hypothetical protein